MIQAETRQGLWDALRPLRQEGRTVGLVPTMGFLHEGHLSLVSRAREHSDAVVVSVFVNPLQFGPGEDLDRYPRDLERDVALLRERGADLVFCPGTEDMYPDGEPEITVDPGPMGQVLCGAYRPGHFRGVLTVVARLFGLVRPDLAVFGQKDYQQGVLIRRMTRDLELRVEILLGPVIREPDGLAMSSRNVFLSAEERGQATGLHQTLMGVQRAFSGGVRSGRELRQLLKETLAGYPLLETQYAEIVGPQTLAPVETVSAGAVVAVAAFCGPTRLIDNHILEAGPS